jgi:hypothetical protein
MQRFNTELAYRVLDHITAHPETWNQEEWRCRSGQCFAGWAALMSGWQWNYPNDPDDTCMVKDGQTRRVWDAALQELGLTGHEDLEPKLFDGENTLGMIECGIEEIHRIMNMTEEELAR